MEFSANRISGLNDISQFYNHVQRLKGKNSGRPLDNKTWDTNDWPQHKPILTQWSSLPFCVSSLIVQWPARICHFYVLHMIVKLAYYVEREGLLVPKVFVYVSLRSVHDLTVKIKYHCQK